MRVEDWVEAFKLHAQTPEHRERLREAQLIIKEALARFKKPYVAYSGGKDSTCLLHLVLKFKPDITVLHWDYGPYLMPRELEHEILENARKIGARNIRVETSPKYLKLKRSAVNVLGSDFLGKLLPRLAAEGFDAAFIALRAEEAVKRRLRVREPFRRGKAGLWEVYPLRSWTWMDVWSYIYTNSLPILSYYLKYCPILGWDKTRFVTLFDKEFEKYGTPIVDGVLSWRWKHTPHPT